MGLFNPKNADETAGGLFPNDEDAEIVGAACVRFDYNGKGNPTPAIRLDLMGGDLEKPVQQYFGVGKAEDWAPSPDGKSMIPTGKRRQIKGNTNAMLLYKSLETIGVPEEILDSDDVTALVGIVAHWVRSKIKREGLEKKDKDGKVVEFEALVATSLISLPGEKKEAGAAAGGGDVAAKAMAAVLRYLAAPGVGKKGVKKSDLPMTVIQDAELASDPDTRNAIMTLLVQDDAFLAAGPWDFANGVIKAKA